MGKQQMKDGGGKREWREGMEREPLLSSRKVTGCGKAHRVTTLPLTATGSTFGN